MPRLLDDMLEPPGLFADEIPGYSQARSNFNAWLGQNITDPLAKAGYPNLGAAGGALPSTLFDAFVPQSPWEMMVPGIGTIEKKGGKLLDLSEMLSAKKAKDTAVKNAEGFLGTIKKAKDLAGKISDDTTKGFLEKLLGSEKEGYELIKMTPEERALEKKYWRKMQSSTSDTTLLNKEIDDLEDAYPWLDNRHTPQTMRDNGFRYEKKVAQPKVTGFGKHGEEVQKIMREHDMPFEDAVRDYSENFGNPDDVLEFFGIDE